MTNKQDQRAQSVANQRRTNILRGEGNPSFTEESKLAQRFKYGDKLNSDNISERELIFESNPTSKWET